MEIRRRLTRDETRNRILAKAEELFRRFGPTKTTVADIAGELGMSTANIYKFFPSKDAILEASAANDMAHLKFELLRVANGKGTGAERIETMVLAIVRRRVATFRNEKQLHKLILTAVEQNWPCLRQFREDLYSIAAGVIRSGIDAGEFGPTDPAEAAVLLIDCLSSVTHPLLLREIAESDVENRASAQVRFLAKALR